MQEIHKLDADHRDLIHDVSYDFYGKRMATCSSDQMIKVWDLIITESGEQRWEKNDEWKAHEGSVLRVAWAHPEYGQVIASCSVDKTVRIWEEKDHEKKGSGKRWVERARLVESRGTVQDFKFAPKHLGLKMATFSSDGYIRTYEAMDVMNLQSWNTMEEWEVVSGSKERDGSYCLSWCKSRFHPPLLVAGCGKEGCARIYKYNDNSRKWVAVETLPNHREVIHDVSWAPNMGRSYHLIATSSKDKYVRIFKLREEPEKDRFKCELVAEFEDHGAEVWKVEWNITGTILASSGDDGKVRLWKANDLDVWKCISTISNSDSIGETMVQ